MNRERIAAYLRKDGWLLGALLLCAGLCLLLGLFTESSETQEQQISRVLSGMAGAGHVEVTVYSEESVPCGAVAVADGAGSISVRLQLTSALSALLGLPDDRIAVYPREGGS